MATAIIGVGNIGGAVARHLVSGGEPVVLAANDESKAEALADELGPLARAASVEDAIAAADAVVFALWLDALQDVIPRQARGLEGKVVIDPSNPVGFDANGQLIRTLPVAAYVNLLISANDEDKAYNGHDAKLIDSRA